MIAGPIIKLIEGIVLSDLRATLEPLIESAQVGFLRGLITQTHLLRMIGKAIDHKRSSMFSSGAWLILFLDFQAAFDQVDQSILLKKLELTGVKERTLNIIRLLYNP